MAWYFPCPAPPSKPLPTRHSPHLICDLLLDSPAKARPRYCAVHILCLRQNNMFINGGLSGLIKKEQGFDKWASKKGHRTISESHRFFQGNFRSFFSSHLLRRFVARQKKLTWYTKTERHKHKRIVSVCNTVCCVSKTPPYHTKIDTCDCLVGGGGAFYLRRLAA